MKRRQRWTWIVYGVCVLLVVDGLGWITWHSLRLDRRDREARAEAQQAENTRLALWRLDARVSPLLARESARPYFEYRAFHGARRAYTAMWSPLGEDDIRVPSPLLLEPTDPLVRLYFQIEPDGRVSSPQAPDGNERDLAESVLVDPVSVTSASARLERLRVLLAPPDPAAAPLEAAPAPAEQQLAGGRRATSMGVAASASPEAEETTLDFQSLGDALASDLETLVVEPDDSGHDEPEPGSPAPAADAQPFGLGLDDAPDDTPDDAFDDTLDDEANQLTVLALEEDDDGREFLARQRSTDFARQTELLEHAPPPQSGANGLESERAESDVDAPSLPPAERGEPGADEPGDDRSAGRALGRHQPSGAPDAEPEAGPDGEPDDEPALDASGRVGGSMSRGAGGGGETDSGETGDESERRANTGVTRGVAPDPGSAPSAADPRADPRADSDADAASADAPADLSTASPAAGSGSGSVPAEPTVRVGAFDAAWIGDDELVLRREVRTGDRVSVQGVWVDWPVLRRELLDIARELAPNASIEPVSRATVASSNRMTTVPAVLLPGAAPPAGPIGTTLVVSLVLAWVAVVAAVIAIGVVLRESVRLGERRGRFVSAVTHELRTPLTTFTLYSQMLADGMVPAERTPGYLQTLKAESERLGRVVESVLAYARLDRGAKHNAARAEPAMLEAAIERARPELEQRADRSDRPLEFDLAAARNVSVQADQDAIGRILVNLVENACKYAVPAQDPTIRVVVGRPGPRTITIRVEDHGPGVPESERRRVFLAFQRGSTESAAGGLGIGLSLARGLAREMRGDLSLSDRQRGAAGAAFTLTLPISGSA